MRRYSAAEAISPALTHTREWFFTNSSIRTRLKLGFVALLAGFSATQFSSNSHSNRPRPAMPPNAHFNFFHEHPLSAAMLAGLLVVFCLFILIVLYISARMKFTLVNALATRRRTIGPIWALYGSATLQWFAMSIVLVLISLPLAIPAIHTLSQTHKLDAVSISSGLTLLFLGLVMSVLAWVLRDFVMPFMAIDGLSLPAAFAQAMERIRMEPGAFAIYILLKLVVSFVALIAAAIVNAILDAVVAIPFVILGVITLIPFWHGDTSALFFIVPEIIVEVLAALAVMACVAAMVFGPVSAFIAAWGLYFLGGRYATLGEMLEPTLIAAPYTPPPSFPTGGTGGGPDLPLNPEPIG